MTQPPSAPTDRQRTPLTVFDPQSGLDVTTGLRASSPPVAPTEPEGIEEPEMDPAVAREAGAVPPAEYARIEYGAAEFDWEPTYSEAESDEEDGSPAPVPHERAWMFETPEYERPQVEPPRLDSGRHSGWDAGFTSAESGDGEETGNGAGRADGAVSGDSAAAATPRSGRRKGWRSIPRAE